MTGHASDRSDPVRVRLRQDRDAIDRLESEILAEIDRHGYPKPARFAVKLAFEEAVTNAFQHGHRGLDPDEDIVVEYSITPDEIRIAVEDRGPGFQPGDVPDPTLEENLANPSGRGLMLMRAYMSSVLHNDAGNRVEMSYRRPNN